MRNAVCTPDAPESDGASAAAIADAVAPMTRTPMEATAEEATVRAQ